MKRFVVTGFVVAVVLAVGGYFVARPYMAGSAMGTLLDGAGFSGATIDDTQTIPDGMAFNGIHLDDKNLNTIQSVTLRDDKNGRMATINKLVLTGDWEHSALPDIAGMNGSVNIIKIAAAMQAQNIKSVVLNAGQIDLVLPVVGILHLQAKGQMNVKPDGSARLDATLWSDQKQFKGQVNVKGEFSSGGTSSIDFEVVDGKIDFGLINANRMGGWLVFNKTAGSTPWTVSSQIVAGQARLYTLALHGATLSAQGSTQDATVNLQSSGMDDGTSVAIDAKLSSIDKNAMTITAKTNDLRGLINGVLDTSASQDPTSPGGIVTYQAEADTVSGLIESGSITVADQIGGAWMNGALRKMDTGMDLDIQQAAMKNFANVIGIQKLTTEGSVTGLLSLHGNAKGGVVIEDGLIRSATAGVLSIDSKALSPQIETTSKNALDLLKSFAYDKIEVSLSSAEEGIDANIKMSGHALLNLDTKPTQMNFHFEGAI